MLTMPSGLTPRAMTADPKAALNFGPSTVLESPSKYTITVFLSLFVVMVDVAEVVTDVVPVEDNVDVAEELAVVVTDEVCEDDGVMVAKVDCVVEAVVVNVLAPVFDCVDVAVVVSVLVPVFDCVVDAVLD